MIRRLIERLTAKIDAPLLGIVACLLVLGFATLYSAAYQAPAPVPSLLTPTMARLITSRFRAFNGIVLIG